MADLRESFDERETELNVFTRTPISFVIVGKPGSGKSTLAKRLAAVWKCQLVDGANTIEQLLKEEDNELAEKVSEILYSGQELNEELVGQVIKEKLCSSEIQHYGYVLDCLPSYGESWKTISEQIELLKSLPQPPNIIINLKIPDVDLLKRRIGQRVDPLNNEVFIRPVYDPDGPLATSQEKRDEDDDDEREGGGDGGESDDGNESDNDQAENEEDEFREDLGEVDSLHLLAPTIADRLVKRAQDSKDIVESEINHYKQNILSHIEDYIIQHNHQYVIELDANLSSKELFRSLLLRLTALGLSRAIAPKRLVEPDEEDEENTVDEPDPSEIDQFLNQVSETGLIIPKFRWKKSHWGLYCPVELARGNMVKGKLEFSVGLLDKMYCLSSAKALTSFIKCPRAYLVPPNPRIPCKICVLGPPTSGKTTLANALAVYYNATVIDVDQLMKPVLEQALERNIKEAGDKAKEEVMSKLMIEQEVLTSSQKDPETEGDFSSPPPPPPIPEDHPEILAAIKEATEKAKMTEIEASVERYVEALSLGISQAEEKRRERKDENENRDHGGWIIDGFPFQRDHWPFMEDAKVLPDFVVYFDTSSETTNKLLMKRYCDIQNIPDPYEEKETPPSTTTSEETESSSNSEKKVKLPPILEQWQKKTSQFETQWNLLSGAMKGLAIDPIKISPLISTSEAVTSIVQQMEDVFKFTAKDLSGAEDEIDNDDDPILQEQEDEEEEDDDENTRETEAKKRKPWGDSSHFCPVSLQDSNVLWPGQPDNMARYKEKLYYFSSEEAKEKFMADPSKYVADKKPLEAPAPRIFLLGPRASGKTVTGRLVAEKLGVFHVSFRDFLQDQIMSKMKYAPLQDPDMREGDKEEEEEEEGKDISTGDDLDEDVCEPLNDKETELRAYLLHDEPLSEETLEEYTTLFWNTEPYKSTGFIMEGLPQQGDELRYMCSKGLYPDAVVILEVEESRMLERVLPNKMNIWRAKRDKRHEKRRLAREAKLKEWENDKAERRAVIEEDYKRKKEEREAQKKSQEEDDEEEDEGEEDEEDKFLYEELQEQLAELEAEEPPEEEEEEEETEEDVEEKMKTSLVEKYEEKVESMSSIQDVLNEFLIPCHTVPANRKVSVVAYSLGKVLTRYFENRQGILTKCTPIDTTMAKKLLDHGYKQLSKFGYWCPVQLLEEPHSVLPPPSIKSTYPVIFRQRIYFTSSQSSRTLFMTDPELYLKQNVPRLPVPVSLAIVGPPKSGKTTLAQRFVNKYGCVRLSIGEAIRKFISLFPDTDLTVQINSHLRVGQTIPEELCVLALERMLLDVTCSTRGYILDGWPITKQHVDLLNKYRIIPVKIVELNITNKCMLERAELFRQSTERTYPMHDSPSILLSRSGHYHKHIASLRDWYTSQHDNWSVVDGQQNHWHVWRETHSLAIKTAVQIQHYLIQIMEGQAASINCLCVTPSEFKGRLSNFGEYCPIHFTDKGQLVDCSLQPSLEYAVEYKAKYYRTAGEKELISFLSNPERYTVDLQLPTDLPCKRSKQEIKEMFPRQFEIQGFCPVTYVEGKKRYKALVPGNSDWSVEYKGKLYCCASKEKLEKFMKRPTDYIVTNLPVKLPPLKQPLSILSLPMLGYMEQSVATPIINSLTAVGCYKPKFPFLTATQSALIYVALHLKAYNPKSSTYVREKYRKKLQNFEEQCKLIGGLGEMMKKGYQEPHERPIDFESQMMQFLDLVRT